MKYESFHPGQPWLDTNGKRIHAHGGSIFYENGRYYWYGENKEKTTGLDSIWHWGIRCYASSDLYNWDDLGLIIPPEPDDPASTMHPSKCVDRPHIIYNRKTGKYVCWLKVMSVGCTVLTADALLGPYTIVHEGLWPLGMEPGDFDLGTLTQNIPHLKDLTGVTLNTTNLTLEEIEGLRAQFPEVSFTYTVTVLGQTYPEDATEMDLSAMTSGEVSETAEKLPMLPDLETLKLTDADGNSSLSKEDVKLLQASTDAVIDYTFDFFGKKISTADEEIVIQNVKIGDEGLPEVRLALDILPGCKRFVLENCQISNEEMAKLRDEYREQTKVVWRISFGRGTTLTDAQVIRAVYDLVDSNCDNLKYCEDARFMDIGHNEYLKTSEFISGMKSLEYVIISGSMISDLKPFGNCKNLKVLEAAFCEYIESVEGLETCESLEYLNISYTKVTDLSPLDKLNLKDLCAMYYPKSRVPQEEQERFRALKPDCEMNFVGSQPYGTAWRYDEQNNPRPWYALIRTVSRYDWDPNIPNHVGWYYEEDAQAAQTTQTTQTTQKTQTAQPTQATEATEETEATEATETPEETQAED